MPPVCFVMFQGGRTNANLCWQEGGFLPRLREFGDVFIYQNKLYNIFHGLQGFADFPADIEFDLDYLSPEAHLRGLYADVRQKFPQHVLIAIGWSAGAHLAYGFAQLFPVKSLILFDPTLVSPAGVRARLKFYKGIVGNCELTPMLLADLLGRLRRKPSTKTAMLLLTLGLMRVTEWVSANLARPIRCQTFSFINLESNEEGGDPDMTTSLKVSEVAYLKKYPEYHYRLYVDEDHDIYASPKPQRAILKLLRAVTETVAADPTRAAAPRFLPGPPTSASEASRSLPPKEFRDAN